MLTVIFASISSYIDQLGSAVSKDVMDTRKLNVDVWTSGLISLVFGSIIIFLAFFFKITLTGVSLETTYLWTFFPRVALEILQLYLTFTALKLSDLSTFGFIRMITIILVVLLDLVFLDVRLKLLQYLGITLVIASIFIIFKSGKSKLQGWFYGLLSAINGAVLIVLTRFQFNHITPFLSESIVRLSCIIIVFAIILLTGRLKNKLPGKILWLAPFKSLTGVLNLLALSFGNASIYTTAERGGSVVSAVLVGHGYFKEKSFGNKMLISLLICLGVFLLFV